MARAELLAVQHRVDAFQLVVDVSGVGVYRAFDGQEAHQQLVEAVVVFDGGGFDGGEELDPLFDQAVSFVTEKRKASISGVQRQFRIGYNRAARIIERLSNSSW